MKSRDKKMRREETMKDQTGRDKWRDMDKNVEERKEGGEREDSKIEV